MMMIKFCWWQWRPRERCLYIRGDDNYFPIPAHQRLLIAIPVYPPLHVGDFLSGRDGEICLAKCLNFSLWASFLAFSDGGGGRGGGGRSGCTNGTRTCKSIDVNGMIQGSSISFGILRRESCGWWKRGESEKRGTFITQQNERVMQKFTSIPYLIRIIREACIFAGDVVTPSLWFWLISLNHWHFIEVTRSLGLLKSLLLHDLSHFSTQESERRWQDEWWLYMGH